MKKNNFFQWVLMVCAVAFTGTSFAQVVVNYPTTGNSTFTIAPPGTCSFSFFDNGGSAANYTTGINNTTPFNPLTASSVTFAPANPTTHTIRAVFSSFATEGTFDALYIHNGTTNAAALIAGSNAPSAAGNGGVIAGGYHGTNSPGTVTATNAQGALTFTFTSDTSVVGAGWAATVSQVPLNPCALTVPATLGNFGTDPATACTATVNVATPTFTPGGCNTAYVLQYRINGGAPVVVANQVAAPATVSIPLPKGAFTLTWELVDPCGGAIISTSSSTGTVVDDDAPVITCAPNVTLDLGPGECRIAHTYTVGLTDNCPFLVPANFPLAFSRVAGNFTFDQLFFNIVNNNARPIEVYQIRTRQFVAGTANWQVHSRLGGFAGQVNNAAAWTLNGSASNPVAAQGNAAIPLSTPIVIPAGGTAGVAVSFPVAQTGTFFFGYLATGGTLGPDANGVSLVDGGAVPTQFTGALLSPRGFVGDFDYNIVSDGTPTQTAGLASGAEFPIGVTTNCFLGTDVAGNTATCCFTVTVREYPNATNVLTCNSLVNISLDQTCSNTINADQILEGGPYRCYERYVVEVDRSGPNFTNGPWAPGVVGAADVNKTLGVRVTDPATGNMCWGNIFVEDKLPPTITCRPINVDCGEAIPANPAPAFAGGVFRKLLNPNDIINGVAGQSPRVYSFDYSGDIPAASTCTDVNVRVRIANHTWVPDLNVEVISPSGQTVSVYTLPGCAGAPTTTDLWFDDAGGVITLCAQLNGGGNRVQCLTAGVATPNKLAPYNGGVASGVWQVRVTDVDPLDQGTIEEIGLEIGASAVAGIAPTDNCGGNVATSFVDTRIQGSCALGFAERIIRKWTATDAAGLTATCEQVITVALPNPGDVVAPPNYDDITEPALDCATAPEDASLVTPDYLESIGLQGYPYINGAPVGCTIGATWDDQVVDVCDGTYKIRREWHVIDWCTGGDDEYVQIIKVIDDVAPVMTCPANLTVSTNPGACAVAVNLPDVVVFDACSRLVSASAMVIGIDPATGDTIGMFPVGGGFSNFPGNNLWYRDTLAVFGTTPQLPLGKHIVVYTIEDHCGNQTTCEFDLVVLDLDPPVAVCDDETIVSIGYDDPADCYLPDPVACKFAGVSWVKASSLDNGSYDNCGSLRFTVRRMPLDTQLFGTAPNIIEHPVFSSFIDGLNGANGRTNCFRFQTNQCTPAFHDEALLDACGLAALPSEYAIATGYYGNGSIQTCDQFPAAVPGFPTNFSLLSYAYTPIRVEGVNYNCAVVPFVCNPTAPLPGVALVGQDSIKFYCDEVGTTQMVILRAYQIDGNGRVQLNQLNEPIYNECMVEVTVQDKLRPTCVAPANVTVTCENFDPSLWAYGTPTVSDNCCLDITREYNGTKGITHSANFSQFDTICNRGVITRTFRAFDCAGLSSVCTQRVTVTYNQDYFLHLPGDRIVTNCDPTGNYGEPVIFDEDCELVGTSYTDELITVVPDACYKIIRTWKISNWCTYNPDLPCVQIPNPNPNAILNHPSNLNAPFLKVTPFSAGDLSVPVDFRSTLVSITPGAPQTDYTAFYQANANCYEYSQVIKVTDNNAPVIANCPASPVAFGDVTDNDGTLWNDPFFNDPIHNIHDLCEMPVDLSINASDLCAGTNVTGRYLLFLDTDNSGDMETVVNSLNPPAYGFINVGNAGNLNYTGGNPLRFDKRPVPGDQVWRFGLQQVVAGGQRTFRVGFNTLAAPNTYVLPQLPHGTHKIKWLVTDGCGNEATCEYTFTIRDTKAPTVVCLNGISVNIMPTGMIDIWDTELLQYTVDNCTPNAQMAQADKTAICTNCTSFPLDQFGNPVKSVRFNCSQLGTQTVRIWSRDAMGNADYCETYVLVQDNNGNCQTGNKTVAGDIKSVTNGAQDVDVAVAGSSPAIPNINLNAVTSVNGHFQLNNAVPVASNFTVTPVKDGDYLNGVDMLDVLKIQRHILGLEVLNTPYKMIAADVNNTGSITSSDIVELRKLILGATTAFANVNSYRFVDKSYVFPNAGNPFTPKFPELISVAQLVADDMDNNFEAMKMGDVTGNAVFNSIQSSDDRTAGTLLFDVADRKVAAGEEFVVDFTAAERVLGYQFTMNAKGLDIVDVVPGAGMDLNNFAVFAGKSALTTVVEDAPAQASFSVKFRATQAGDLSKMLNVSSAITKAVAYSTENDRQEVGFRFNGQGGTVITGVGFELYQNQPNPFINSTVIGFHLPEATTATLNVYDELGRVLFTQKGDFSKGYNAITLERSKLNTTGVLFYTLETANASATKQMIQTK